jgi:hypothetical protein
MQRYWLFLALVFRLHYMASNQEFLCGSDFGRRYAAKYEHAESKRLILRPICA